MRLVGYFVLRCSEQPTPYSAKFQASFVLFCTGFPEGFLRKCLHMARAGGNGVALPVAVAEATELRCSGQRLEAMDLHCSGRGISGIKNSGNAGSPPEMPRPWCSAPVGQKMSTSTVWRASFSGDAPLWR